MIRLQFREQLTDRNFQAICNNLQVQQADVSFATLYIGQVAAVDPQNVSHFRLRPAAPLAQIPQAFAERNSDIGAGHSTIIRRRLSATNRI